MKIQSQSAFRLSEDYILRLIDKHFPDNTFLKLSRGDDCAVIQTDQSLCISSDLFLEDIHFRKTYFTAHEIGHKALAVNLSDLAACGATPLTFTLSLGLPDWVDTEWLDNFFSGMASLAQAYNLSLCGGDLSRSKLLYISITIIGQAIETRKFLKRGQALPGDILFLIGDIGLARIGLEELEKSINRSEQWQDAYRAHLTPIPQIEAGLRLAELGAQDIRLSLMDISDGLVQDLPRLLNNSKHLGAKIEISREKLPDAVIKHAEKYGKDPIIEAILGGEDYALLGSCDPEKILQLNEAIPNIRVIGKVIEKNEITCNGLNIATLTGFDHFANSCD